MVVLLILMAAGMIVGYLIRRLKRTIKSAGVLVTVAVYLLLLTLGIAIGRNEAVLSRIPTLGVRALLLTIGAVLGSVLAGWLFARFILPKKDETDSQ